MDDKVELGETLRAMRTMGINDEEKDDIIALTAGVFIFYFLFLFSYLGRVLRRCSRSVHAFFPDKNFKSAGILHLGNVIFSEASSNSEEAKVHIEESKIDHQN